MISIQLLGVATVFAFLASMTCGIIVYKIYRDIPDDKPNKVDIMGGFAMAAALLALGAAFAIGTAIEHSMEIEKLERQTTEEKSK